MRKVITINLNGNAYQVDDSGYEALRAYLERAEAQLAGNPDRAEIIADLEQAIGDKCDTFLGGHKNVVTAVEVEQILKEMGPVEHPGAAPDVTAGATAGNAAPGSSKPEDATRPRRLYRLPDEGMMGGVCAGLAAYFHMDVVWVRIVFVVLAIGSSGFWFFVWLGLVFVMPRANTPEEVAAAYGEPFNAKDVIDRAKKKSRDFASAAASTGREHWEQSGPKMKEFTDDMKNFGENVKERAEAFATDAAQAGARMRRHGQRQHARYRARYRRGLGQRPVGYGAQVAAGVTMPVISVISAALFVVFVVTMISLLSSGTIFGWMPLPFAPHWVAIVALVTAYFIVSAPIRAARRASHRYANGGSDVGWASAADGLLWIGLVVLFFWLLYQFVPGMHELFEGLPWVTDGYRSITI